MRKFIITTVIFLINLGSNISAIGPTYDKLNLSVIRMDISTVDIPDKDEREEKAWKGDLKSP